MSVCIGHMGELFKKAKLIEMSSGELTRVGPRNHVSDKVQIPHGKVYFCVDMCLSVVMYLRMTA